MTGKENSAVDLFCASFGAIELPVLGERKREVVVALALGERIVLSRFDDQGQPHPLLSVVGSRGQYSVGRIETAGLPRIDLANKGNRSPATRLGLDAAILGQEFSGGRGVMAAVLLGPSLGDTTSMYGVLNQLTHEQLADYGAIMPARAGKDHMVHIVMPETPYGPMASIRVEHQSRP